MSTTPRHRHVLEVLKKTGRIDVLINNAGIGGNSAIEEIPEEVLRAVFETNFFGAMRLIRAVLPGMRQRQSGAIVNVTSVSGRMAFSPQCAYATSKFVFEAASEFWPRKCVAFTSGS